MLKIGLFSKLSRVSIRMLRYYDEMGLLRPAYIDPDSDYRYYREDQLQTVGWITALRDMGCEVVLLTGDERWADAKTVPAYYIHNLVTVPNLPGAGKAIPAEIDRFARQNGKASLHLDCSVDSAFLNAYYESQGYRLCGQCQDGPYYGNRREKRLPGDGNC